MHPALSQGRGDHLDSRTHYLGRLSCRHRCLLLHLGLRLWLLHHQRSADKFQLWLGI